MKHLNIRGPSTLLVLLHIACTLGCATNDLDTHSSTTPDTHTDMNNLASGSDMNNLASGSDMNNLASDLGVAHVHSGQKSTWGTTSGGGTLTTKTHHIKLWIGPPAPTQSIETRQHHITITPSGVAPTLLPPSNR